MLASAARPEIAVYAAPRAPAVGRSARSPGRAQKFAAAAAAALCLWTAYADPLARERALHVLHPLLGALLPEPPPVTLGPANARRVEIDGQWVLYVEGSLRNGADRSRKTPTLLVTLVGDDGRPLYSWKTKPTPGQMPPSAEIAYKTRLASPPETFRSVSVSLADGG